MKVHVDFVIDVDADTWAAEYGIHLSEVSKAVAHVAREAVMDQASILAGGGN